MDLVKAYRIILILYMESLAAYAVITGGCIWLDILMIRIWRKDKKLLDLAGILAFFIITVAVASLLANHLRDIPNIQSQNYVITQGIVVGQNTADLNDKTMRGFDLARYDTGEVVSLHVHYGPIPKGMRLEVIYLPYSKMGAVIRELPEEPPND